MRNSKRKKILTALCGALLISAILFIGTQVATDPGSALQLIEHDVRIEPSGERFLIGSLKNHTNNQYSGIQAEIVFLNIKGIIVGSSSLHMESFNSNEIRHFEARIPSSDAISFRIRELRWRDERYSHDYVLEQ